MALFVTSLAVLVEYRLVTERLMETGQQHKGTRRLHFARAMHSRHPLPADRQCSLSSACRGI